MINVSDFETRPGWSSALVRELDQNRHNGRVGSQLVSETDRVRVWHLSLPAGERFGFHCHVLDYFWTALAEGQARSRYGDGRVVEVGYSPGETRHLTFAASEFSQHDLENIGCTPLQFVTVEFKDSANPPLPL